MGKGSRLLREHEQAQPTGAKQKKLFSSKTGLLRWKVTVMVIVCFRGLKQIVFKVLLRDCVGCGYEHKPWSSGPWVRILALR